MALDCIGLSVRQQLLTEKRCTSPEVSFRETHSPRYVSKARRRTFARGLFQGGLDFGQVLCLLVCDSLADLTAYIRELLSKRLADARIPARLQYGPAEERVPSQQDGPLRSS